MATIAGSIDDRGRPVVRLAGRGDDLLLTIDTGFNGELMLSRTATPHLDLSSILETTSIELGDGTRSQVEVAQAVIGWLGADRTVQVFIADDWTPMADSPVGLIGTRLLTPHLLLMDFGDRTVEIEGRS